MNEWTKNEIKNITYYIRWANVIAVVEYLKTFMKYVKYYSFYTLSRYSIQFLMRSR